MMSLMTAGDRSGLDALAIAASGREPREARAARIADTVRGLGDYRWVGLYDVDEVEIILIAWSGAGPPAYPRFPRTHGLSGAAVATRRTVVSNDVRNDPRYLTAFGDTRSEIIVPILRGSGVVGTIDIESATEDAFSPFQQQLLEECAASAQPLWR
jgi:putative methionine-R-sulfoxide reductase with GAF domain